MVEVKNIRKKLSDDLYGWGGALIIMGILHVVFSSILWTEWGVMLIILGILCSIVKHITMFILLAIGLIFVGLLNVLGGFVSESGFWVVFGGFQIYWGVKEIVKFKTYKADVELNKYQVEVIK